MKILKLFFILLLSFLLFNCIKPENNVKKVNILDFINNNISSFNNVKNDKVKKTSFMNNLMNNINEVLFFKSNSTICIRSSQLPDISNDTLFYSLDNNNYILNKGLYITYEGKDLYFSLDNIIWYSTRNDNKNIDNSGLYNDITLKSEIKNNTLIFNVITNVIKNNNAKNYTITKDKSIVKLTKGMVLSSDNEQNITIDLKKTILFVPEKTIISGKLLLSGNIIQSENKTEEICITSLQDIFIYIKQKFFSISFDEKNWDVNILSFHIDPKFEVKVIDFNKISYEVNLKADYQKDSPSSSIIKLLLGFITR